MLSLRSSKASFMLQLSLIASVLLAASAGNFYQDVDQNFGDQRFKILEGGRLLTLSLDKISGSGFQSKNEYLFGRFDMQLKLIPGNSAGTVTTFYLSSQGAGHDEIDFEFLGNSSGLPYTLHTNVYAQGKGGKEQQFRLWFDPTSSFHTYSMFGTPKGSCKPIFIHPFSSTYFSVTFRDSPLLLTFFSGILIRFLVDNIPIRVFNNQESMGVPFPKNQAMRVYCSLWNADDWATQGGRVKTDWTNGPFTVSYRNFNANGCVKSAGSSTCGSTNSLNNDQAWQTQGLDANGRNRIRWVQQKYMIYNYCTDVPRFPQGFPSECKGSRF